MATYVQADRPLSITTALGPDDLLPVAFTAVEGVSQLFAFHAELLAVNEKSIAFDKLLGQKAVIHLTQHDGKKRHFAGIVRRVRQGERDETFTHYGIEVVPQFWLLTKRAQSRIFQHKTAPDILKKVLAGLDVTYDLQGTYHVRDYCVQYRETDFNFAARLMEEEGIFYFFKHTASGHQMVVADNAGAHPDLPGKAKLTFEGSEHGLHGEDRVIGWHKEQELASGKFTLWDHCFEVPHKPLDAQKMITDTVQVGKVAHKLKVGNNDRLEIYDFPGEYAQRYDGVDASGGDRPADIQNIYDDNKRTVEIRMQQEAAAGLLVNANSTCRNLVTGHKFALEKHHDADGLYLITGVHHHAKMTADYRTGEDGHFLYNNSFTCIPLALTFRPARVTPKPFVQGTQTAQVVGPAGEEIFTDKYGRVKVQFFWDREGKKDAGSSCWIRVGSFWAGKQWGGIHIPRIGQEVIVGFEEGDPDQPIILGSVYNADQMPPYDLPANKTQSGVKSRSTKQGSPANFNELRFEDKKGSEQVYFHAEKNFDRVVENNDTLKVGFDKKDKGDQTIEVFNNQVTKVGTPQASDGSQTLEVYKNQTETIKTGNRSITVEKGNQAHNIKMGNRTVEIGMGNDALTIKMGNQTTKLNLGKSNTEAMQSITLKVGQSSIVIDQMGIKLKGMMIDVNGQIQTSVKGLMTDIKGTAMLQMGGGITMIG